MTQPAPVKNPPRADDGRGSLTRGVAVSWVAQMLQIIAGFIIPRLIDRQLGRELLGVWDLGWSMVSYFTLLDGGIGSTINRHVALHRAEGDFASLNRAVSSVAMLQRGLGALILLLTLLLAWKIPFALPTRSPELATQASGLVLLLGASMAVAIAGAIYGGILTGCHRWPLQHGISVTTNLVSLSGMCVALWMRQGLVALAAAHFASELLGRILRAIAAHRACPGLDIRARNADLATLRKLIWFGGKMFVGRMSQIVMHQTVNIMIASHLGLAALALFSRPKSLVRQAAVFPQKYGNMLVPTAATLLGRQDKSKIQKFAIDSTRNGLYLSLPVFLFLALNGGPLLHLWMGAHYVNSTLVALLSFGFLAENAYQPLNNILFALNFHGRPSLATVAGAACALLGVGAVLGSGSHELSSVALAVVIPWSLAHGVYVPVYACRRLELPLWTFLKQAWMGPLACVIPFGGCLLAAQWMFPAKPLAVLGVGGLSGTLVLLTFFWFWVFPERWKDKAAILFRPGRLPVRQVAVSRGRRTITIPLGVNRPPSWKITQQGK